MRAARFPWLLLISGCANVFGFQDLRGADADVPDGSFDASADAVNDAEAAADVAIDAPLVCDGGATVRVCGGQCVDVATSGANCGACGHDCGGGLCTTGVCQPAVLADSLANPVFDIDSANVTFNSASKVVSCPLAGCKLQPTQIIDTQTVVYGSDFSTGAMMVAAGNVFYVSAPIQNTTRPTLYDCAITGCTPQTLTNTGLQGGFPGAWARGPSAAYWMFNRSVLDSECTGPGACSSPNSVMSVTNFVGTPKAITADGTGLYFIHPDTGALTHCPTTAPCSSPETLLAGVGNVTELAVQGTNLYMLNPGTEGGIPNGIIRVCPTTGACTPQTFIDKQPNPTHLAADANGVYWFDFDAPLNSTDASQIVTCPLTGCAGGPKPLALAQSGTTMLRTDASFVYWATGSQILRVAK